MQEDVDILAFLEAVMDRNTRHYKQDFGIDRKIILEAAASPEPERRRLLWLSRPCGTECFYERDAYIRESYAHHAWTYHAGTSGPFAAYAIEITGLRDGRPVGNLYELDYRRHAARVNLRALPAQAVSLAFADGYAACCGYAEYRKNIHALAALHGAVTRMTLHPEDEHALDAVLREDRAERSGQAKKRGGTSHEPDHQTHDPRRAQVRHNQGQQLACQTSCIGHMRADFGSGGDRFHSSWEDHLPSLNDAGFKEDIDQAVNALREDGAYGDILASRGKMESYCRKHPESSYGPDSREYGFRADTEQYAYLLRLNPNPGEYNLYAYCYVKAHLDRHLKNAEAGIRFITPDYRELFRIPDGDQIRILTADDRMLDRACRFIDETHVEVGGSLFHICEFAEKMERAGNTVVPLRSSLPDKCFGYDAEADAVVVIEKGVPGWELAGRRLNGMSGQERADQLNQEEGVTCVQAAAMLAGAVHGWAVPEADPASYDASGRFHEPL